MEFNKKGLEELYTDGVLNPAAMSSTYVENAARFKQLDSRVFLLYEPDSGVAPRGADFDIVLLHGIGSDEFHCWTNAQGFLWPAVFFPQDFPTARVLTVGYAHSLFNWKAEGTEEEVATATRQAAAASAITPGKVGSQLTPRSTPSAVAAGHDSSPVEQARGLADRVRLSAAESAIAYGPQAVTEWWSGRTEKAAKVAAGEAPEAAARQTDGKEETSALSSPPASDSENNPLFQLLSRIRDSTGALVAAEDDSSATKSISDETAGGTTSTAGESARGKKAPRDIRSLQSMRIVAAELAERLCGANVGVGQRPVVFLVHSMGGLILKQMLISLFEAARLAPPSAAALSLTAATPAGASLSASTTPGQSREAVQKANQLLRAVRGVVFYGTPHFGSALASVITGLQKYYQGLGGLTPTSVVTGLGDHNKQELVRLNDRFFDIVERLGSELTADPSESVEALSNDGSELRRYLAAMEASREPSSTMWWPSPTSLGGCRGGSDGGDASRGAVSVLSFGETRKLNGLVLVVDPESANPAPDDPRYPFYLVNADHGEVCRPLTKMSPSYAMVYGMLDRMQQRGRLRQHSEKSAVGATGTESLLPPRTAESAAAAVPSQTTSLQALSKAYERGWTALFDRQSHSCLHEVGGADTAAVPSSTAATRTQGLRHVHQPRAVAAFQQGVGETRLALPVLEEALAGLQQVLDRFFGDAVPSEFDAVFLLAADVIDFVTRFYRRGEAVLLASSEAMVDADRTAVAGAGGGGSALVDEVVSFCIPLQLLTYWVRQATDLLRGFEQSRLERGSGGSVAAGSSSAMAAWVSSLATHPSTRDSRELAELGQSVGVLQEEWEAFRRFVSLRLRASANERPDGAATSRGGSKEDDGTASTSVDLSAREHIAALFFARAIRTAVSQHVLDGGAIGGLLGAYLRSAILQIYGSDKQLLPAAFASNPWAALESASGLHATTVASLVLEGLELSLAASRPTDDGSVLLDVSGSGVALTTDRELRAIVPALTATSAVLLGCFTLHVDRLHRLDADAQGRRAAAFFQLAKAALAADRQTRAKLQRVASRSMQRDGVLGLESQSTAGGESAGSEREWWKAAWDRTASKQNAGDGASLTSGGAGAVADTPQPHVAKLDDGLFHSATLLTVECLQCSLLLRQSSLLGVADEKLQHARSPDAGEPPALAQLHTENAEEASERKVDLCRDAYLGELTQAIKAAQHAYTKTMRILCGEVEAIDSEKPFAPPKEPTPAKVAAVEDAAARLHERSVKDQFRDAIRSILSELDDKDDIDEAATTASAKSASFPAGSALKAVRDKGGLSWKSHSSVVSKKKDALGQSAHGTRAPLPSPTKRHGKSTLPTLIMNSLAKAWDAVRSGGAAVETPEHFAYNAMVLWWMVEWEAAAVIKAASLDYAECATPSSSAVSHSTLRALASAMEAAQRRRNTAASSPTAAASPSASQGAIATAHPAIPSSLSPSSSLLLRRSEEEKCERACWAGANAAVRCRWMTQRGGEQFLDTLNGELSAERDALAELLTTTSADRLRQLQTACEPPTALVQLDVGGGGTQLGIPSSLLDAVQHDDTSAALRCWLGHCYAVNRLRSPDAAHAYMRVLRSGYAAHTGYTVAAEVGLAWHHVHNVSCGFSQLWRTPQGSDGEADASSRGVVSKGCEARSVGALLGFHSTGVVDTAALVSAPPSLVRFCRDAVLHHAAAVDAFEKAERMPTAGAAPDPHHAASRCRSPTRVVLGVEGSAVSTSSLRHLRLAEEGFQRALRADPTNAGALCGLGRLRSLSASPAALSDAARDPTWSRRNASHFDSAFSYRATVSTGYGSAANGATTEPLRYFQAALQHADGGGSLVAESRASAVNCAHAMDAVWWSYAAYWMSEELLRAQAIAGSSSALRADASAAAQSQAWLIKSLRFCPRNDWALTSLGLLYLSDGSRSLSASAGATEAKGSGGGRDELNVLRGLALLQRSLAVKPTNVWTLWGIGTYGQDMPQRSACQRLLRTMILKNVPKLM